jgi:predicted Zn-dependent peptidase
MMYQHHRLSNGIRLIHRHTESQVAHCALMINTGSRDEENDEQGLAHFIEHLLFKGTKKRKAFHIMSHMENVGGEINAFTSKEDTCIYGSFMHNFYRRWFDIVSDITFNAVFPEKEMDKEKDIIIDEINSYLDSPAEQIFDDFDELVFNSHPLGRNILGTPAGIKLFDGDSIRKFISRNYVTEEMLICSVGRIHFAELIALAEKYFGDAVQAGRPETRESFSGYLPQAKTVKRQNHQAHCMLGNEADGLNSARKTALSLLNNILGGPGLNARLNMSVREKHGLCYNIESIYQPYSDAGVISIYFGTDSGAIDKTLSLIHKELKLLREKKVGSLQLKRAKTQFIGQLAISSESNLNEMLFNGKNYLYFNQTETHEDISRRIEAVDANDLMDIANEVFHPDTMSMLLFKP